MHRQGLQRLRQQSTRFIYVTPRPATRSPTLPSWTKRRDIYVTLHFELWADPAHQAAGYAGRIEWYGILCVCSVGSA
eukprot:8801161-Pyramimonas_sp.AAC.1